MASAAAYSLTYCVHTLEMNALRGRSVAFLAFVAASTSQSSELLSRTVVVTVLTAWLGALAIRPRELEGPSSRARTSRFDGARCVRFGRGVPAEGGFPRSAQSSEC